MYLSKSTVIIADAAQQMVLESLSFAAAKLWNVGNYEKKNWQNLGLSKFPDWMEQKKNLKTNYWYKALPSHSAQLVLKKLNDGWKSYFALLKTGVVLNPKPPRFKRDGIFIPFDATTAVKQTGAQFRFTISKQERQFLKSKSGKEFDFLYVELPWFAELKHIKEVTFYPQGQNKWMVIAAYEVADVKPLLDNGRYLSIDLGVKNIATCYSSDGDAFIIGKRFLELNHYFNKQVAHYQSISDAQQASKGVKYPKKSKRMRKLYQKYRHSVKDLLHKSSAYICQYCVVNHINTVIVGDITGIRDGNNLGRTNQAFHALPYKQFVDKLEYKLKLQGITLIKQVEAYSSQCSPFAPSVGKQYAQPKQRVHRGLYKDGTTVFNADVVGAFNIMRLAIKNVKTPIPMASPRKVSV